MSALTLNARTSSIGAQFSTPSPSVMRINAHSHIFNLQTVLTHEAVRIIAQRVSDRGLPEFVVLGVERLLDELVDRPENLTEDQLLARFVDRITQNDKFKAFLGANITRLPVDIRILGDGPTQLGVQGLRSVLDKLSTFLGASSAGRSSVFDVFETLRIALESSIAGVADHLLDHMQPDDAIVALMMDITSDTEPARDAENFSKQIKGTSEAALQRPGRILPFIAVNTRRPNHFALMQDAIESRGFVGVKLYPSLGYEMDTPAMHRVLDYCVANDTPIVMHCTKGGFYASQGAIAFCNPLIWEPLLENRPTLRICFAHCGGEEGLEGAAGVVQPGSWTEEIVKLMGRYPNVVMDISYHDGMMSDAGKEHKYFATLKALVAHPSYRARVLWGTDSWLLRLSLADDTYWKYFTTKLTPAEFSQIAEENTRRFLGLPAADGSGIAPNMLRYVNFIARNRDRLGAAPTPWLATAVGGAFDIHPMPASWTLLNQAHYYTYSYVLPMLNASDAQRGFAACADVPMKRLSHWLGGPRSIGFDDRCAGNALRLAKFCLKTGARYEAQHNDDTAVKKFTTVFADANATLSEFGAAVDAIYRFDSELA